MTERQKAQSSWTLLLDYGPLLAFFAAYKLAGSGLQGTLVATLVFMLAAVVSVAIGLLVVKRISPMVWLSTILIVGFGGVTLYLHRPPVHSDEADDHLFGFRGHAVWRPATRQGSLEMALWPRFPRAHRKGLAET